MQIFRIQHKDSGLGPFQHGKQEVLYKGVRSDVKCFEDLDQIPEVKKLLKTYKEKLRFGFTSEELVLNCIKDKSLFDHYGFSINSLSVEPLYVSPKGTVIFLNK